LTASSAWWTELDPSFRNGAKIQLARADVTGAREMPVGNFSSSLRFVIP
jgi:hypothetical protein